MNGLPDGVSTPVGRSLLVKVEQLGHLWVLAADRRFVAGDSG
jgi:hypothetical protein